MLDTATSSAGAAAPRAVPKFTYALPFQKRMLRVLYSDFAFTATTATHLKHEHFETPAYRWIAQKILTYAKAHGSGIGLDALRIEAERDGTLGKLNKEIKPKVELLISSLDKPVADRSFIKEELFRFIKNQTTRTAIINSLDHLDMMDFDAIDQEFSKVLDVQESLGGGLGHFYVRDVQQRTRKRKEYTKDGIATGIRVDDYLKAGGLPPKALGCIVAPSGIGKSNALIHFGRSGIIESNAKVLHVTTELSEEAILDRYDAAFTQVAINKLELKRKAVRRKVRDLGSEAGECLVVKEFPPATLTAHALRAYVRQLERVAFYPTLIIVDSADDMIPSVKSKDNNTYQDMGGVYRELRKLSYDVNAPVWTVSQSTRAALNKEFFDWNLIADSAKKVMVADVVLILLQTLEEKKQHRARFFIAKNRQGVDKIECRVQLDWSKSTIRDA